MEEGPLLDSPMFKVSLVCMICYGCLLWLGVSHYSEERELWKQSVHEQQSELFVKGPAFRLLAPVYFNCRAENLPDEKWIGECLFKMRGGSQNTELHQEYRAVRDAILQLEPIRTEEGWIISSNLGKCMLQMTTGFVLLALSWTIIFSSDKLERLIKDSDQRWFIIIYLFAICAAGFGGYFLLYSTVVEPLRSFLYQALPQEGLWTDFYCLALTAIACLVGFASLVFWPLYIQLLWQKHKDRRASQ